MARMSSAERFIAAAKDAGCPRDQVENVLRAGAILQPKQLTFAAAARLCDADGGPTEVGFGGARGGGKSHAMLLLIAADDCQRFPGLKCLLLRKVGKALKEGFEDLLRRTLGTLEYTYIPSQNRLTFPNGSQIILGHFQKESDIDAYLGLEYDVIGVEEATTLSASKVKAIRTCNRSSKAGWRPRMYFTTNPGGIGHVWFFERMVKPHRPGREILPLERQTGPTRFVPATVDDNRCVNSDYSGQLDELTGWQLRAWRHGDWDIAAGQYFTTFRRDVHAIAPFRIPKDWLVWGSLDYGWTHYTVFQVHALDGDGTRYTIGEHAARGWLVERHATAIKGLLGRLGIPLTRLRKIVAGTDVFARKHTGATIASDYKSHGMKLTAANTERINGWGEMLRVLGDPENNIPPKWYIFETCTRLLDCLPALQHDPHNPEDVLKWDTDEDGHGGDDPGDCARYGLMVVAKQKQHTTSAPKRPRNPTTTPERVAARSDEEIDALLGEDE